MIEKLNSWIDLASKIVLLTLVFLTPLLFWGYTTDFYETPKFLLLALATGIIIILWIVKWIISGNITFTPNKLDIPLLLILIVFIVSMFFAASRSIAIFGNLPRPHGGLASYVLYTVFYIALASNLRKVSSIKEVLYTLLGSGIILSIITLLSYAGINVFSLPWTGNVMFTPTGSSFSTSAILLMLTPFPLAAILHGSKISNFESSNQNEELDLPINSLMGEEGTISQISVKIIWTIILTLFMATIVLIGSLPVYIATAIVFILTLFITSPSLISKNFTYISIPVAVAVFIALISFLPIGGSINVAYKQAQNFPREIQLPFQNSWKISVSAFRDSPFWGSGPASYLADYTVYKPVEINNTNYWNIRFDSAFNEYLQFLGTLGATGLIALLLLTVIGVSAAFKTFTSSNLGNSVRIPLAVSSVAFFIILLFHTSTLPVWVIGIIILVAFFNLNSKSTEEISLGTTVRKSDGYGSSISLLPIFVGLIILGFVGYAYFQIFQVFTADYHHRLALKGAASGQGLVTYNELILARNLNPQIDLYRSDMAQTNFALANAIAMAKGPTETSPSGTLTEEDKQNIQALLSQSIDEGRAAVALNPNNPINWEILGSIYRQISGVAQNALSFSLDSYGRAITRDPLNPVLRLTVGGIYFSINNYDMAIRFFTDAVNLKPDYANANFNLAIALAQKGDFVSAQTIAERTVSLLDPKSEDYKIATQVLSQIKDKVASQAADQAKLAEQQAEATSQQSSLQDKNLPKVLNLPAPENVSTPAAIKKQTPK
jgi:tetratricopeptide (TPR) repeat protein/O-antigen ligase